MSKTQADGGYLQFGEDGRLHQFGDVPLGGYVDELTRRLELFLARMDSCERAENGDYLIQDSRSGSYGGARTLYQHRKPRCRSLDGVRPVTGDTHRSCADCKLRLSCTPQVRLDLIVERRPFRLLLAYSSARAFLVYDAELRQRRVAIEDIITKIAVVNRGSWGELRFGSWD